MSVRDLLGHLQHEIALPQILADLCVHSLIEQASCTDCVDACPRDAWILNDAELALDTDACDGCGLCRPACPQQAITHDYRLELRSFRDRKVALVACERAGVAGDGVVPCLNALDLPLLMEVSRQGIGILLYSRGDCSACDRARNGLSFDELAFNFQQLAESHGFAGLTMQAYSPLEWVRRREVLDDEPVGTEYSRRGFLRGLLGRTVEQGLQRFAGEVGEEFPLSLDDLLPAGAADGVYPNVPEIDPSHCSGCDACVKVCPRQAIVQQSDPPQYRVQARRCSGCKLCVDVCRDDAMVLKKWVYTAGQTVELHPAVCTACGAPFHRVTDLPGAREICQVCAAHGHHNRLYQVLPG